MAGNKDTLILSGAHSVDPLQDTYPGAEAINPSRYSAVVAKVGASAPMDVGKRISRNWKTRQSDGGIEERYMKIEGEFTVAAPRTIVWRFCDRSSSRSVPRSKTGPMSPMCGA